MQHYQRSLLALVAFLCLLGYSLGIDYADIYARSRELPAEREILSSISFQLHRNTDGAQKRTVNNASFASDHSMSLSFKALSREFSAYLHQNAELFSADAVVSVYEEDDLVERYTPESNGYIGEATIDGNEQASVSAVVVDYERGIFHMSIWNEASGESYVVEPTYLHPTLSKRSSEDDLHDMLGNNMVVFKETLGDIADLTSRNPDGASEEEHCGNEDETEEEVEWAEGELKRTESPDFGDASATSSCPPRTNTYLLMGVTTDSQYVRKAGGASGARNTISYVFNTMQSHYYRAVRNKPVLKTLILNSSPSSLGFNTASCPSAVQSRLTPFCSWRTRQSDRSIGLWHLLSGCLPDRTGVAGRAYYSAICLYTTRGCGITGYMGGNARWVIPAHEIGHNYGARHSSNIMASSVNSRATGFASTSVSQMCSYTFRSSARSSCLVTSLPRGVSKVEEEDNSKTAQEQSSAARTQTLF